ncbi:MAG: tetraacyldisaccharide 4'-kinase [Pseudomonadota bacterium]
MRAPKHWADGGPLTALLTPLGWLYDLAGVLRFWLTRPVDCGVPVLCVGNLVAGGAGKTPVALALAERLLEQGFAVHFLTRGYGGRERGPLRVEPARHGAREVGDEALLLAALAPTWVARDRVAGARAAITEGARVIVMDDGFQNPRLAKTLSLIVLDGAYRLGNGRVLPAGPLRERPSRALKRAQGVALLGGEGEDWAKGLAGGLPLIAATLTPTPEAQGLTGRRLLAFAGIGRPDKFFASLKDAGAELVAQEAFPDHHPYGGDEVAALLARAKSLEAQAITTEKDRVRLPPDLASQVEVLPVAVAWRDPAEVDALLGKLFDWA